MSTNLNYIHATKLNGGRSRDPPSPLPAAPPKQPIPYTKAPSRTTPLTQSPHAQSALSRRCHITTHTLLDHRVIARTRPHTKGHHPSNTICLTHLLPPHTDTHHTRNTTQQRYTACSLGPGLGGSLRFFFLPRRPRAFPAQVVPPLFRQDSGAPSQGCPTTTTGLHNSGENAKEAATLAITIDESTCNYQQTTSITTCTTTYNNYFNHANTSTISTNTRTHATATTIPQEHNSTQALP